MKLSVSALLGVASAANWRDFGDKIPQCHYWLPSKMTNFGIYTSTQDYRDALTVSGNANIPIPTGNARISNEFIQVGSEPDYILDNNAIPNDCGIDFIVQHYTATQCASNAGDCSAEYDQAGLGYESADCKCTVEAEEVEEVEEIPPGDRRLLARRLLEDACLHTTKENSPFFRPTTCGTWEYNLLTEDQVQAAIEDVCLRDAECTGYSTRVNQNSQIHVSLWYLNPDNTFGDALTDAATCSDACPEAECDGQGSVTWGLCCCNDANLFRDAATDFSSEWTTKMKTTEGFSSANWPTPAPVAVAAQTAPVTVKVVVKMTFTTKLTTEQLAATETAVCAQLRVELGVPADQTFECTLVEDIIKRLLLAGTTYTATVETKADPEKVTELEAALASGGDFELSAEAQAAAGDQEPTGFSVSADVEEVEDTFSGAVCALPALALAVSVAI